MIIWKHICGEFGEAVLIILLWNHSCCKVGVAALQMIVGKHISLRFRWCGIIGDNIVEA